MQNTKRQLRTRIGHLLGLAMIFSLIWAPTSLAEEIAGVTFSDTYQDEGVAMELRGTGLKSVIVIRAFAAGYYQGTQAQGNQLGEFAKRIEVAYFVSIPGKKLNKFTIKQMKENVTKEEFQNITDKVELMSNYFTDLKPGDRYSLTYIPGVGTKFAHNERITGVIEGREFARALFSVWIGKKPFDKKLKHKILGLEKDKVEIVKKIEG